LSVLLYLNDDYEGGEIEFRQSGLKFKPEAGSVLFFPSNFLYVHEVYPVTRGPRYALPNWYHNVPLDEKRDSTGAE
jgi:predicted 2-oxoglutarate/Fe(II)-dependent dioxygenase YbiX